ncbi:MAG TPA: transglycosylase domain-containing protein [Pseudolabrys sp.]|jgi:penicillin-binding protein 1C|nr:transglycosylase domain-containing protein [Pseudolabrys sp.]
MKRGRLILAGIAVVAFAAMVAASTYVYALGPPPLGRHLVYSRLVFDGNGKVVHAYATPQGRWRFQATVDEVDPRFLKLLFAYEDKRFYEHHGVDLRALGRAALQWITSGHVVSGGSTLTMQVARLLEPRRHRTIEAKLRQIVRAIEIEMLLSKKQVLSLYLTLAPYGGNLEGIRAASLAYFGKEPRKLTLAQAALLVALPQSPERRRPDRYPQAAREARNRVLERALAAGELSAHEVADAEARPVPHEREHLRMLTPHRAEKIVAAHPDRAEFSPGKRPQVPLRELDGMDPRRAGVAPFTGE